MKYCDLCKEFKIFTGHEKALKMIREQLQNLKGTRKSVHTQVKRRVIFGDTSDLDDETILELIPIQTPFTRSSSLGFDRQRHSREEEEKFNGKFSKFLRSMVRYGDTKDIEYLLDYLVRRYSCDTFNQKEMIFLLLPFKRYYGQVVALSSTSEFNYFIVQPTHSYQFIGNLCLKDKYFFDFFVGYFEYFGYIRDFCTEVLRYIISGMNSIETDFSMQFFEIISNLLASGEKSVAVELFFEVRDHVTEVCEEFVEILVPFFTREYLMKSKKEAIKPVELVPYSDGVMFMEKYNRQEDREFLSDVSRYKSYVAWLSAEHLPLVSISSQEFEALKILCGISKSEKVGGRIEDYFELFRELVETIDLVGLLSRSFPEHIHLLIPYMKDSDKVYLSGLAPSLSFRLITEGNHSRLIKNVSKGFMKENILELMRICLNYINYDSSAFLGYLSKDVFSTLMKESIEDVFVTNIINTARAADVELVDIIVQMELYFHSAYLDYISEKPRRLELEMSRSIFNRIVEAPTDANIASLCRYICQVDDPTFINDAIGWVISRMYFCPIFYSSLRNHLEVLSRENCEEILELKGFAEEIHFVLDRLYNVRSDVVDECLAGKHHKALLFLCKRYGFSNVLGSRKTQGVVEFVRIASQENLTSPETEEFVFYISTLIMFGGNAIINVLLRNEYIPYLIRCSRLKEWKFIKVIISESVLQCDRSGQYCFDYFVENHPDFEDDLDLLDVIVQNNVSMDYEKLARVFSSSSSHFKAGFAEVLLERTSFDPLRFIPLIAPSMIEHKKKSLGEIFKRCGNIMGLYVKDILIHFPDIEDDMLELDTRYLLLGAMKAYAYTQDDHHLEFLHKVLETSGAISLPTFEAVAQFLNITISNVKSKLLIGFFGSYLKSHGEPTEFIKNLLGSIYKSNKEAFFSISNAGFSFCHTLFEPYASTMVEMIETGDKDATVFITNYLYWDPDYDIPHLHLFKTLFRLYCNDADVIYAKCIGSVLRHNSEEIETANDIILGHMKGDKIIMILELLQVLYQKVYEFKRCLVKSSPYFALVVDSTRKDVPKAARKLFSIIEKKHSKSGYQLLHI